MIEHQKQTQTGRKGFIWLILPGNSPSLKEVRAGTWCRSWCSGHGGRLLTGLLPCLAQPAFLEARSTSPRVAPPTMDWALPDQSLIKILPYRFAYSQILWRHSLNWGSLLSDDSGLCQADIKLASTQSREHMCSKKVWQSLFVLVTSINVLGRPKNLWSSCLSLQSAKMPGKHTGMTRPFWVAE